jgi:hypothetical protein
MTPIRIAFFLAAFLPAAALAEIGPQARELMDINKKSAEPTCNKVKFVLEMAGAQELGQTERLQALKAEVKKIDEDPKYLALSQRGNELAKHPFNAEEKQALRDQMGSIQNACPWLRPTPKK